jgi:hypothetical protein
MPFPSSAAAALSDNLSVTISDRFGKASLIFYRRRVEPLASLTVHNVNIESIRIVQGRGDTVIIVSRGDDKTISVWYLGADVEKVMRGSPIPAEKAAMQILFERTCQRFPEVIEIQVRPREPKKRKADASPTRQKHQTAPPPAKPPAALLAASPVTFFPARGIVSPAPPAKRKGSKRRGMIHLPQIRFLPSPEPPFAPRFERLPPIDVAPAHGPPDAMQNEDAPDGGK